MVRTKSTVPRTGSHNYYTFILNKEGKCGDNFYYFKRTQTKQKYKNNRSNRKIKRVGKYISRCILTKLRMVKKQW